MNAPVVVVTGASGDIGRAVAKAFGAHGIFNQKSSDRDTQVWASQHHGLLGAAGGLGLAAAAFLVGRRR